MAANSVELIRDAHEAFAKGDLQKVDETFSDDIVFHVPGRGDLSGKISGKAAVFEWMGQLAGRSEGTFAFDVQSVYGEGDQVVSVGTVRGERNGKTLNQLTVIVWRVEGGKAVENRTLSSDQHAEDDLWS
jgi:uncharacterized protein